MLNTQDSDSSETQSEFQYQPQTSQDIALRWWSILDMKILPAMYIFCSLARSCNLFMSCSHNLPMLTHKNKEIC